MKCKAQIVGLAALAVALSGCSTPARRIAREPEVFASFPPEIQAQVREGRVALGFTRDMVRLALGPPDRTYRRTTAGGTREVWAYTQTRRVPGWPAQFLPVYSARGGRLCLVDTWVWPEPDTWIVTDRLRIEFEGDRTTAIEDLTR